MSTATQTLISPIRFFVPGLPAPGGSKRVFVRNGKPIVTDDAKRNKDWRAAVALAASVAWPHGPMSHPLRVRMTFVLPRPASHLGTGRNSGLLRRSAPPHPCTRPDVLKLARSTEDALTGVLWGDDSQTVILWLAKQYGPRPGVEIEVQVLEGAA